MTGIQVRAISGFLLAGVFILAGAPVLQAQSTGLDTRWQAWLGCWRASDPPLTGRALYVCVVPASGSSAVNVVSIADGKEISRERVEATGQQRLIAKDGCTGWEGAQWSADSRRVYLRSELTCPGTLQRTSSGVLAISGRGEWLDVQVVRAGGGSGLALVRYQDAGMPAAIPAEIAAALAGRQRSVSAARLAAGAPIGTADVVDAARNADPEAVNGWLVERGQALQVDAGQLAALSDAGVPGSVTDVMLALSYPDVLALNRGTPADSAREADGYQIGGRASQVYFDRFGYSPFGWGYSAYRSPYGYSPYGYSGSIYGAGYGSYWNRSPYIIVTKGSSQSIPRGRAVNGRGYTRGDQASGSGRTSTTPSRGSVGSSSTGTSRPTSGSGGRTAKPRR
jgi:hypothetical protein